MHFFDSIARDLMFLYQHESFVVGSHTGKSQITRRIFTSQYQIKVTCHFGKDASAIGNMYTRASGGAKAHTGISWNQSGYYKL